MKEDIELFNNWEHFFSQESAEKLLDLWLERCKYVYALAFLQWRRVLKG